MAERTREKQELWDDRHARHWDAVEEASELLVEKRYEEALLGLKEVLAADPNNPYAYHLLGTVLWELGRIEPARDAFRAAVLLAPEFLGARVALSHASRKLGDLVTAERDARAALAQFPDDGEAHHALGLALASRGRLKEAGRHLEIFLASKPELEAQMEARGILEMVYAREEGEGLDVDDE
jgi:Flp pilus assembly protein TadD